MQKYFFGVLTGCFIIGLLWFFTGRIIVGPLNATAKAIRAENRTAQSYNVAVTEGLAGMERTVTLVNTRSDNIEVRVDRIKIGSRDIIERSDISIERVETIEERLRSFGRTIEAGITRFGLINGIVGGLRDLTETFREAIKSRTVED